MKNKVLIFVDLVAAKNKLQLNLLQQMGLEPICFINNYRPDSDKYFSTSGKQILLEAGFLGRLKQTYNYFKKNKSSIHHLEIYPGGRFAFIYLFLAKWFSLKTICAERGDLLYFRKKDYHPLVKFSMYCCYRFADVIWYREIYMKSELEKITKKPLFFLHNAIHIPEIIEENKKEIDFLWLNRVIPERKARWFLNILKKPTFKLTNNFLVGIEEGTVFTEDVKWVKENVPENLQLRAYSKTPQDYFKAARFFVLPADVVFANHALLEAMSYGVVPLISRQPGSDLIVDDKLNGFIFEYTEEAMEATMNMALQLPQEAYKNLADQSRNKMKQEFSLEKYEAGLKKLYAKLY